VPSFLFLIFRIIILIGMRVIKKKQIKKKEKWRLLKQHNSSMSSIAKRHAASMRNNPSELEKKMLLFLNNRGVIYDFQRVFNIKYREGKIIRFFIVDFYIPKKNLVIETDGKFHGGQVYYDEIRTQLLQFSYPNIKVIRWRWQDFQSIKKLKELAAMLKDN
jgi:very-short-patch-repair endonuclease